MTDPAGHALPARHQRRHRRAQHAPCPGDHKLRSLSPADVGVCAIVMHELSFGAFKSTHRDQNLSLVDALRFEVPPLDTEDARHAGDIRAWLAAQGTPIGAYDVLIAGQARARGLVLVTRSLCEFERVPGLNAENWQDAPTARP